MKAKKIILVLLLIQVGLPTLFAQSVKEQKAEIIRMIISSKNYKLDVDTYLSPYREPILLDYSQFSIEIKNDTVFSNLLYISQTDIIYNRGKELLFQAPIEKYTMNIDKRGNIHIKFLTYTETDKINFKIDVYCDGSANVYATMLRGRSIGFSGELSTQIEEMESL
jgi:tagatose-1,6-bisphosphate aldolase